MKRFSPGKQRMSLEQHASQLTDTIAYLIGCGLDPGMIGCSFSGPSVHSQPALSQLLDLINIPFENTEVEKHLLSRLTRLLIENARTDPFKDGVVPERVLVALSVIWRDSGYLVANGILSQDTWLVDYNAVLENSNEKMNETPSGLHSHSLSLLDAPYLDADAKPDEVDHEARRCQEECTALGLLLAAGLDAKWFTEPNLSSAPTSYSGHILHTAMRKACDAWSHAVAKSSKNVTGRITTQVVCNFCYYPELTGIGPLLGNLMQLKRSSIDSLKSKCDRAMAFKRNIRDVALNSDSCKSWLAELKQNAVFRGQRHSAKCPTARYSTLSGDEETVDPLAYLRKHELLRLFCIIANKLLDTLIACLKHGVNPRSRNTQGVSATIFARHCHILQLWEVSLDIMGFDLATIDELFVSDAQMALAENNYRIVIDLDYLSIIYSQIWIYHCWRGVVKLMGGGRTLFPPIKDIVAIPEGINKRKKRVKRRKCLD
jgi:hypothetical protein